VEARRLVVVPAVVEVVPVHVRLADVAVETGHVAIVVVVQDEM
jgi:hypothetical protein